MFLQKPAPTFSMVHRSNSLIAFNAAASTECYCLFISTNVKVNECYRSACITTIDAGNILGYSKGINTQINVLHGSGAYD